MRDASSAGADETAARHGRDMGAVVGGRTGDARAPEPEPDADEIELARLEWEAEDE